MEPWSHDELEERLRAVGAAQYHDKHPFHKLMNEGKLNEEQLRTWCVNRLYYQKNIPIKDAILLSKIPHRDVRRKWIKRITDHDGTEEEEGGIEKWLVMGEAMGLSRDSDMTDENLLPGTRYAVDAYVNFVRQKPWVEGCASSLTELFAPVLHGTRLAAFEKYYTWIDPNALRYMRSRPPLATRDCNHALEIVHTYCTTREMQEKAIAALKFKCDLLWAQLDALYYHFVNPTTEMIDHD
jgi:pyrroloquinoline-quinone synthase